MTKNQLGLVLGFLLAIVHAVWSLAVAFIPETLQWFINLLFALHHLSLPVIITPFILSNAIVLVIFTFVVGYIVGWVAGWLARAVKK